MSNSNLVAARKAKNDEFYTQLPDIEAELQHYTEHFRGKTIYCNCDDPEWSNFWRYFEEHFDSLGLKALIATHYSPEEPVYKQEIRRNDAGQKIPPLKTLLPCNGDFRSAACIELLKEADIVVTNPPFSLFREYVAQLMEYEKKFLIIGSMNAITYKEFFPLLKDNLVWLGPSIHSGDREFRVPDSYPLNASGWRIDEEGRKYIRVKGVRWFTNLEHKKRPTPLDLRGNKYYGNESMYPRYDNYDAIECSKVADIPEDYFEHIGVPITFLDKYCPEQFELANNSSHLTTDSKGVYHRLIIKRKRTCK